jgi:ubiquitin C-terminal hydrolase
MAFSLSFESTLEKSIAGFFKEVSLDSGEAYRCDSCQKPSKAKIQQAISCLPKVLVFQLKRFAYPAMKKIKGKSRYPSMLDLSK